MALALADIVAARRRIADGIYLSPCPESIPLSEITGVRALCKLDYLQRTGSFKERGARNALLNSRPSTGQPAWWPLRPAIMRWAWLTMGICWGSPSPW